MCLIGSCGCACACVFVLGDHVCVYLDHACACVNFFGCLSNVRKQECSAGECLQS